VSADEAAQFLSVTRRYVLELARSGIAGAYGLGTGTHRKIWVFRLSELAQAVTKKDSPAPIHKTRKMCDPAHGSPR
jgi:excisionase family DNA binding protein